ncbi:MAG: hypothetical protein CMP14_10095 [Rickettsiales bacterium]|nr:hypothetical protein [Rickettsiales bacterium]
MKIELLKNAFRGVMRSEARALKSAPIVPRKRCQLPVASMHFDSVNGAPVVERAKLLAMMSKVFNPQCMTRGEAEGLINVIHDAELLTKKDIWILRGGIREGIEQSGFVDLIVLVHSLTPVSTNKDDLLELLNSIVGLRYRAAG